MRGSEALYQVHSSAFLEAAYPMPVFVSLAFGPAITLPHRIGAFAEALMLSLMPEVVGGCVRPTRLFPKQIGALANDLIQTRLRLSQHAMRVSEWG